MYIFYLFLGINTYKRDKKSKVNSTFLILCTLVSIWNIGYAFMLIAPTIETANLCRIVAILGECFFSGLWVSFAFSLKDINQKKLNLKIQTLIYISAIILFINNLMYNPSKVVGIEAYGFVDNLYINTTSGIFFRMYNLISFMASFVIIYFIMKSSKKNRVRIQMKTILIINLISFCFTIALQLTSQAQYIVSFPYGSITISISMAGMWYAINKHKMMSISYEIVSEYIFEAVNEPIIILDENFLVKDCNEALINITGYNHMGLEQNSIDRIINFRGFSYNSILQVGNVVNLKVYLYRKNKEPVVCELSATVIYDEYKDVLGILIHLHDVSERENIAKIQKKYTLKLEKSNLKLKKEITERLLAENQIRHFVYYDALTELFNRKRMREDVDILLFNKNEKFAFLFIDLDKFKSANDNYGHQAGDYILKTVAVRLKSIISSTDTVYRIGGDEFIIIIKNLKIIADVEKMAIAISETLSATFIYNENQLFIRASIGISIFPEHGIDQDTLSTKADLAMYKVKREGGNGYKIYCSEMKEEDSYKLNI